MDASRGSRENPMSAKDVWEKFEANARRTLPAPRVEQIWAAGMELDSIQNVEAFVRLLSK